MEEPLSTSSTPSLLSIFLGFLRLGCSAFGGPAMVPYIRDLAVERKKWCEEDEFRVGIALTQVLPGATAMQVAAWAGLRARGVSGALVAYLGFGLPAFGLMLVLSALYMRFRDVDIFLNAFSGLKAVVLAVVAHAAVNFSRRYCKTLRDRLLALAAGLWLGFHLNPILAIVGGCLLALFLYRGQPLITSPTLRKMDKTGHWRELVFLTGACLLGLGLLALFWPGSVSLALLMLKIDIFAFGGGYVSLPLLLHEVVEVQGWMGETTFMDGIALGQITPGPIVMSAAFVGYYVQGLFGALVATLYVFTPSFLVLCVAAPFVEKVLHQPLVQRALHGSLVILVGLMAAVTARFIPVVSWDFATVLLCLGAFTALRLGADVLWVVLCGAALGIVIFL